MTSAWRPLTLTLSVCRFPGGVARQGDEWKIGDCGRNGYSDFAVPVFCYASISNLVVRILSPPEYDTFQKVESFTPSGEQNRMYVG